MVEKKGSDAEIDQIYVYDFSATYPKNCIIIILLGVIHGRKMLLTMIWSFPSGQ